MNTSQDQRWLTPIEVAKELRLHRNTVYNWIAKGILKTSRPTGSNKYFIDRNDLDSLLQKNTKK